MAATPRISSDVQIAAGLAAAASPRAPHEPAADSKQGSSAVDYVARSQWLRAAVLGANDGLVSVSSLMVGVGAVNRSAKTVLISGLAGLVAGACSMAIGEFVSVHAQYDIELAEMARRRRRRRQTAAGIDQEEESQRALPNPLVAAVASAVAFSVGAALPLLAGGFVRSWSARAAAVCAVSSLGFAGFGAAGAALGGANAYKSGARVLVGGWSAMVVTYGVLRLVGLAFNMLPSSA